MTLVVIATRPDGVDVLTDTFTWIGHTTGCAFTSKVRLLPHLDTAVVAHGPARLSTGWDLVLDGDSADVASYDDLAELARVTLPTVWEVCQGSEPCGRVLNAGWSPAAGRFATHGYSSSDGFAGEDLSERMYVHPCHRGEAAWQPPVDEQGWCALGEALHARYALAPGRGGAASSVGGDLVLTHLERGVATQRRIHTFGSDVDDWQFRKMLLGSLHPLGQLGPCLCGSGQPYAVCHLRARDVAGPCPCGSGNRFGRCHRIDPTGRRAADYWARYAGDFARWSVELREAGEAGADGERAGQL